MKSLYELTADDLLRVPVWRYMGRDDTDAGVEPTDLKSLSEDVQDVFIVRTSFVLNDGSAHTGYCSPTDDSGLDYVQPVIITPMGHVQLFHETPPLDPEPAAASRKLRRSPRQIFPLHYRAEVPVNGNYAEGEVVAIETPR